MRYKIARFICGILGVPMMPQQLKTINISFTEIEGDLDLSKTILDENVEIDVRGTNLTSITFPANQMSEGIKIYFNDK